MAESWKKLAVEVKAILGEDLEPKSPQTTTGNPKLAEFSDEEIIREAQQRIRIKRKQKSSAKPICATKPVWTVKRGKGYWKTVVKYKTAKGRIVAMTRVAGRNKNEKPAAIVIRGKKLQWCK